MAKISTYIINSTPQLTDKVIGTDVNDNDITKNYLIQDIVDLVPPPVIPPPTLTPTKMIYGDANSLYAETSTLEYIIGGEGTVAEDTVKLSGSLNASVCSINSATSILLGKEVMSNQSSISNTVAVGQRILDSGANTSIDNVFLGVQLISSATNIVVKNIGIGSKVLDSATKEIDGNIVIGYEAAQTVDVSLASNIIIGEDAAKAAGGNGQGLNNNVAIGFQAANELGGVGANSPTDNIAIGTRAGAGQSGNNNIHIGTGTGLAGNLGFFNIGIGANALANQTGSDFNTAVGNDALQQLTTGVNNTALGKAAGSTVQGFQNTTNLGHNSQAQGDNEVVLGDNNVSVLRCNTQVISGLSDIRDKDNVEDLDLGLDFLMELEPVSWDWDRRDGTMKGQKGSGFIAQEVDEVVQAHEAEDILPIVNKRNPDAWEVGNAALIPVLVKAIQELKAELDACKAEK